MTAILLTKTAGGALAPVNQQAIDLIATLKLGAGVTATFRRHRNHERHRKFFALLNLAFDAWEPDARHYKGAAIAKNFDQFRKDITVLAGHCERVITLDGETRLAARSISFASMGQAEFDALYDSVVAVVLEKVLTGYSRSTLENTLDHMLGFT
jgi:hypothetical protein